MTMDTMHDKSWDDLAPGFRKVLGLRPLTHEEARKAHADAPEADITEEEIDCLLETARTDIPKECPSAGEAQEVEPNPISEDVYQLHRNEGDEDAEVDDLLDQQRREALDDDDDEPETPGS